MSRDKAQMEEDLHLSSSRTSYNKTRFKRAKINLIRLSTRNLHRKKVFTKSTATTSKPIVMENAIEKKQHDKVESSKVLGTIEALHKAKVIMSHVSRLLKRECPVNRKEIYLILVVLIPISLVVGYFSSGLLQSEKGINYYGLEVRHDGNESESIMMQDITGKTFYIKNHNSEPVTLSFVTWGWEPPEACNYLNVSWDYDGSPIFPGANYKVIIAIVNHSTHELDRFSFCIDFISSNFEQ